MNVVGKVGSFITQGMYSVATPFHPFGGAVDIIVVKQNDGTFRTTPWYVRFGKFQGVLKGAEKIVRIEVNGVEANFHMYLDNSGEAYFLKEVDHDDEGLKHSNDLEVRMEDTGRDQGNNYDDLKENDFYGEEGSSFNYCEAEVKEEQYRIGINRLERVESDCNTFYEFQDEQASLDGSLEFSDYGGSGRYDTLHSVENALELQNLSSEVVLVSVDGHILTAPISSSERNSENVELSIPQFHLGPGGGAEEYNTSGTTWTSEYASSRVVSIREIDQNNVSVSNRGSLYSEQHLEHGEEVGVPSVPLQEAGDSVKKVAMDSGSESSSGNLKKDEEFKSCLELSLLAQQPDKGNHEELRDEDLRSFHNSGMESGKPELSMSAREFDDSDSTSSLSAGSISDLEEKKDVNLPEETKQSKLDVPASENEYFKIEHNENHVDGPIKGLELSLCGHLLHAGMGLPAAEDVFEANRISPEEFKLSAATIVKNENLIIRIQGKYLRWIRCAHIILGMAAFGLNLPVDPQDVIPLELDMAEAKEGGSAVTPGPSRRWRLWPIPFRRVKTLEHTISNASNDEIFLDTESVSQSLSISSTPTSYSVVESPHKQFIRTKVPTTDQIASLNLKEGQNMVNFVFSTRVLGSQKVEAHIYLWKWNTRIVISDVDGTITKSDVLGQFMPLVGRDWTHSGIARLFSAIKENGYQLLFLSARAIVQAYLTKSFLFNLKQDGKSLPNGPVVISPDGLFPSLYREVIKRAPHEFKIACLEDIKALFPPDYNPFYAGFGNRDTDELSYRRIGIPKGKIFIINPKGEVAINHQIDVKSYTSLHTLVNDMFPPTSMVEQEDFNSWNYWKMPLPEIDTLL